MNSLTAWPLSTGFLGTNVPQAFMEIPSPPAQPRIPPTKVVAQKRGNAFTDEDKTYFIEYILWQLQKRPGMSKQQLCRSLARKVHSLAKLFFHFVSLTAAPAGAAPWCGVVVGFLVSPPRLARQDPSQSICENEGCDGNEKA